MASFYSSLYFFHIYLFPSTFMYLSTSPLSFFIFPEVSTFFFPSWRPVDPRCAMCCSSTVHVHCTMRARQGFQQSYCPVTYYSYVYCSYSDRYFWIFCNGIPVVSALLLSRAGRRDNFRRPCDKTSHASISSVEEMTEQKVLVEEIPGRCRVGAKNFRDAQLSFLYNL